MRVAGIEIKNHPGIGSLTLDFRDAEGRAPRFIVLAGGNGCGKTAVLEAIFASLIPLDLLLTVSDIHAKGTVRLLVAHDFEPDHFLFQAPINDVLFHEMRTRWEGFSGIIIDLDWQKTSGNVFNRSISNIANNTALGNASDPAAVLGNPLGCFLSVANTVFQVPPIRSVTATSNPSQVNVPAREAYPLFGTSDLASAIPQLLVDLESADGLVLNRWRRDNPGRDIPADLGGGRIKRFEEAFSRLIPEKSFAGIQTVNGELVPQFFENGRITPIAKLSTGEKQIVFRGAFLLRQADHMPGAVVMIDEPELSLHPNWQSGILDYYDRIVTEAPEKKSQIILATHSPFVVHGSPAAKHIVLRRDSLSGRVSVDPQPTYRGITAGEVAIAAFDLVDINFGRRGARLVIVTEGKTDAFIISNAWQKLRPSDPMPFHLVPAGGVKSIMNMLGTGPENPGWLYATFNGRGVDRYLALYDFDNAGFGQWNGLISRFRENERFDEATCLSHKRPSAPLWAALLPVPSFRRSIASRTLGDASLMAIELLFPDELLEGRLSKSPLPGEASEYIFEAKDREKMPFAIATGEFPPEAFEAFQPLFQLCDEIISVQL